MLHHSTHIYGTLEEKFWAKVQVTDTCWLWTASLSPFGYGRLYVGKRMRLAHQVSYEMYIGPIPIGLDLDHLCRVPRCVNPFHLEPVTRRENLMRGKTLVARYAMRTHCIRGHPFDDVNSFLYRGYRICRACRKIHEANRPVRSRTYGNETLSVTH